MSAAVVSQTDALTLLIRDVSLRASRGAKPLVVFDLDDTLLSTAQRHMRILREFAALDAVRSRWQEASTLARLSSHELRYSIADSAKAAGVARPELLDDLSRFWRERFFLNEYLLSDEPVAGAAPFCEELLRAGARLAYMTGRDEAMREGTERSLSRHGFPTAGAVLILKPRFDTPDLQFKAQALARLPAFGEVAAAFENEPAHINAFAEAFPEALMFLLDTRHSGKPVVPHARVRAIKDFRRS